MLLPEQLRAKLLTTAQNELNHPIWSGLNQEAVEIIGSLKTFFANEVTPEQLAIIAARVPD